MCTKLVLCVDAKVQFCDHEIIFSHWPPQGQHGHIKIQQQDETKHF